MRAFVFFVLLIVCSSGAIGQVYEHATHNGGFFLKGNEEILTLGGKPITFYMESNTIDYLSKKAFNGTLDMANANNVKVLFDSLMSCRTEAKIFYFYIFNQIVEQSNEQLRENIASKCNQFVKAFPCEFFGFFDEPEISINVVKWTTFLGHDLKDKPTFYNFFKNSIDQKIKDSCPGLQDLWKSFQNEVRMCLEG